ncbi:MAG: Rib/alpha-like domain-containing protein [Anaerococcus sp.]
MIKKFKMINKNPAFRILIVFLTFVYGIIINFNYSYAQNSDENQSNSQSFYEKWNWLGPNDPIYIDKLEDVFDYKNSSKYRIVFKEDAEKSYELRIYNPLGQQVGYVKIDNPKNNGKDYNESVYGLDELDKVKAGDLVTFTICPKGKREEEKIIKQNIVKISPKPSNLVIVNKGYKFREDDAKLFVSNTLEMPEGTTYSFLGNKPPNTSKIQNKVGESNTTVIVKLPNRENEFLINTKFYVDEEYIPIVENMDYDKIPESCHKLTFYPGEYGNIAEGKFSQMWIRPDESLGIPYPEVKVDRGYEFIGWDYIKDWDAKTSTFKAKYKKLDVIDENKKDSYVNIKFLAGDGGLLEGKNEFLIPKGYSLSKMPEDFIPPKAVKNNGWIFDKWDQNFDLRLNIYSDMVFTAEFKEGQAIKIPPKVQKDISIDIDNEIQANNLITNLEDLPDGVKVEWSEKPDFTKKGKSIGKINTVYPDGSRLENIEVTIDIHAKRNEDKEGSQDQAESENSDGNQGEKSEESEKDDGYENDQHLKDDNSNGSQNNLDDDIENSSTEEYPRKPIIGNLHLDKNLDTNNNEGSPESLSISEKIRKIIIRLKMKLSGIEYIKKNMPYTYKRYQNRLDEAVRKVEDAIRTGEEYLNNSK